MKRILLAICVCLLPLSAAIPEDCPGGVCKLRSVVVKRSVAHPIGVRSAACKCDDCKCEVCTCGQSKSTATVEVHRRASIVEVVRNRERHPVRNGVKAIGRFLRR